MFVIEKETVRFVYYIACASMDHDTALAHAADEVGADVETVAAVLEEEVTA